MPQPLVLLGLGGQAASSEFTLGQIASAYPVILADASAPAWARPHLARHLCVDLSNEAAAAAAVQAFASAHDVGGILTYSSEHLVTAARIAQQLELPSAPADSLGLCADRAQLRTALTQRRVPQPDWAHAADPASAATHADAIGYPVLIKSRKATEASGHVSHRSQVTGVCARVTRGQCATPGRPEGSDGVIVEKHLEGPRVAAETVVLGSGDIQIVAVTRTTLGPPPALQAVRHSVFAHDSLLHNRLLRQTVARAVAALDVERGVIHVEMTLTSRGPRITDFSAHLANDLIPLLVKRATGINLPQIAADLAVGQQPNLAPTRQRAAAIHFAYPAVCGLLQEVSVATGDCPPLVDRAAVTHEPGRRVVSAAHATVEDRLAHWVVLGATGDDCHAALDRVTQGLRADIAPCADARAA